MEACTTNDKSDKTLKLTPCHQIIFMYLTSIFAFYLGEIVQNKNEVLSHYNFYKLTIITNVFIFVVKLLLSITDNFTS